MKHRLNKVFVFSLALSTLASFVLPPALAQAPSDLVVVSNWNTKTETYIGRLEVFRIGLQRTVEHNWQLTPGGAWSGWDTGDFTVVCDIWETQCATGGQVSGIAVGQNADGRLELFVDGSHHVSRHSWQISAKSGWNGALVGPDEPKDHFSADGVSAIRSFPVASSANELH